MSNVDKYFRDVELGLKKFSEKVMMRMYDLDDQNIRTQAAYEKATQVNAE